MTGGMILKIEN